MKPYWTLLALVGLGATAFADGDAMPVAATADLGYARESVRGVAQDYLVLPSGGELVGDMKFVMANPLLGGMGLQFTDLALFELSGRWSFGKQLELASHVAFLAKQPSYTDEKTWQSVDVVGRAGIGHHGALALSGAGGHLMDHDGEWLRQGLDLEWKKTIDREFLAFDMHGGVDSIELVTPGQEAAYLSEVSVATAALFREPSGHWGAWIGLSYALPFAHHGVDPTSQLVLDPQPRLDFHIGTALSLVEHWDLFVDLAVIDRGDLSNPATRLPILDGGFDQRQLVLGVTRHFAGAKRNRYQYAMAE